MSEEEADEDDDDDIPYNPKVNKLPIRTSTLGKRNFWIVDHFQSL